MRRRERQRPEGCPPERPTAEDLTRLALGVVAGSRQNQKMNAFLAACTQYAYAAAIRLGRKHHGAEDSAQDAAKAVWSLVVRNALKPETIGGLIGTLVLRNAYAAAQRRLREASIAGRANLAREAPDSALEVETAEWAQGVRDAVEALPEPLRGLVALRHWDGCSLDEIAQLLGKSRRTISRQLRDAEAALREALRDLDEPDAGPPRNAADR
jgi:RNA polymerase sigma factor (sigma-70 family)